MFSSWNGFNLDRGSSSATALDRPARALLAALLALLLAAPWPLHIAEAATGSTKFIPTFLVYYGGGPALVAADASKLAKFDLIDIDRFRYDNIGPNTWAAIKSINPGVQIYLYQVGPETPSHLDDTPQRYLNGLGRYNVSRGHFMGNLNGNHPELYLLDASGNRVYSTVFSNVGAGKYWHLMDFGSAAYQSYWLTAVKADIIDQPWVADGVFVEDCLTHATAGRFSGTPPMYPSNAAWSGAMNSFVEAITGGLRGYGQKLWCNRGETGTVDGSAAWLALDGSANPPDVLLEEGAFAVKWGPSPVQFHQESTWKRQVDTIGAIRNSKIAMISHTKLAEGQTGTDNWGKPVNYWQTLWYSLGSFLLSKNDDLGNAYFMFNGGSGYDKIWWYGEYDNIDLGKAIGPYRVTAIGAVNIYWREFERGYVYVNPTPNDVALVNLPQASRKLTRENMTSPPDSIAGVSAISLNGHHAAILLKASTDPIADTTAPSVPAGLVGTAVSSSQINLSWNPSTDNAGVTGYVVYLNNVKLANTTATSFQHAGLTAGTTYNYRVSAFDAVPNHSAWTATPVAVTTPPPPDTQAPSVPAGLVGSAVSSSQIKLSWNPSTDNVSVTGYYVYLNNVALGATSATSFQHASLTAGTTYNYRVSAFDAVPNHSAWTATPVAVTTPPPPDTQAPSVPAGLVGTAVSSSQIKLSWNPSTDNAGVTGYVVYLNNVKLANSTATSFQHTSLTPGATYNYRVSAHDAVPNHSAWTATPVAVTTLPPPDTQAPSVPTGLVGSAVSSSQVNLSWSVSTDNVGVSGYFVYRNGAQVGSVSGTSYANTGLTAATTHSYAVAAYDAADNVSAQSNAVSATTPPLTLPTPPPIPLPTPYSGTPVPIPGSFEAENFDLGGEGVAYHDNTPGNQGGLHRLNEDVDIFASTDSLGGGHVVRNFDTGEWMAYTINVATSGQYDFAIRAASGWSTSAFHIEIDSVDVTGRIPVPNTGGWDVYQWVVAKTGVPLAAGIHVLKIVADEQGFRLNTLRSTATPATPAPDPSTVEFSCTFANSPNDCGFDEQAKVPGRATIVSLARDGATAVRLHTEAGDNNVFSSSTSERNDLWLSQAETGCSQGREQWWAHSILLPDDFAAPSGWYLVFQFHNTNGTGQPNFAISVLPNLAGMVLWGYGGETISQGEPQYPGRFSVTTGPVTRNVWYDFVYQVKWSSGSDGYFRAWVNGVKKLDHSGPTLYAGHGCYLKLSNYHTSFGQPSSVIHDRVIRGTTPLAVSPGPLEGVLGLVNGVLTLLQ